MHPNARPKYFGRYFSYVYKKAQARSQVTRWLGAQKDGLRPKTGLLLYQLLVRPVLEYGAQILSYSNPILKKFERLQLFILKRCLGLAQNTKNESVRILCGREPIAARFAFLKLKHLYRIRLRPKTSLVRKILEDSITRSRPGFVSECKVLCKQFDIPNSIVIPASPKLSLGEFGSRLKKRLLGTAFARDLQALKHSSQAKVLASLYNPNSTYLKYTPLDIAVRILNGRERKLRTSFLNNLAGASHLTNHYIRQCTLCKKANPTLDHYFFDCEQLKPMQNTYFESLSKYLHKVNPFLETAFKTAKAAGDQGALTKIMFGANFALNGTHPDLFRVQKPFHSHSTDRICIITAEYLRSVSTLISEKGTVRT